MAQQKKTTTHHKVHFPKDVKGWKKELKQAWQVITLKKPAMAAVAKDEKAFGPAILFVILASFASALGEYIFPQRFMGVVYRHGFDDVVAQTVVISVCTFLAIAVLSLIAEHLFKGKAKLKDYFKVLAYAYLVMAVGIIPALSVLAGIWLLVLTFVTLREVHKIDVAETIGTIVIAMIALVILMMFLMPFLGVYSLFY